MSAPDPRAWELRQDELDAIECNLDIYGIESSELQAPIYAVARRRAIEEMTALAASATEEPNHLPICAVFTVRLEDIRYRIAAIEAEEE